MSPYWRRSWQPVNNIEDYLIQTLPELLRQEPKIAITIEGILAEHFPRRDEFARLLDEIKLLREQMERRFEQVDWRLDQTDQRLQLLRDEINQRFEQVDQNFVSMRAVMDQLHHNSLELRRNVANLQSGQEAALKEISGHDAWLKMVIGDLRNEKGQTLEDMFAAALRYGLKNPNISPDKIRLRQKLVDTEGLVFKAGYETEVDLIAEDGQLTVFEVKATTKPGEVDFFAWKVELVTLQNPDKTVRDVFISLAASSEVRERCARYGLELLD